MTSFLHTEHLMLVEGFAYFSSVQRNTAGSPWPLRRNPFIKLNEGGDMGRGAALVDWKRGVLAYLEADDTTLDEYRKIVELCGGLSGRRNLPCLISLTSRLRVKPVLYITDIYGVANSVAFEMRIPRSRLLEKAWAHLNELICTSGVVECGEGVQLNCCKECGLACQLAVVAGLARLGVEVDLRERLREVLSRGES